MLFDWEKPPETWPIPFYFIRSLQIRLFCIISIFAIIFSNKLCNRVLICLCLSMKNGRVCATISNHHYDIYINIYLCRYVCDYDGDSILINFHKIHRLPAIFCISLFGCCLLTIGSITFSVLSLSLQLLNEIFDRKSVCNQAIIARKRERERERIAYSKQMKRQKTESYSMKQCGNVNGSVTRHGILFSIERLRDAFSEMRRANRQINSSNSNNKKYTQKFERKESAR